jgi:hypothetical protein
MAKRLLTVSLSVLVGLLVVEAGLQTAAFVVPRVAGRGSVSTASNEKFRILTVGDSNTYGIGMPRSRAYPAQLEQLLDASADSDRFEVVNMGVPGSNSSQVVENLPQYIRMYKPHLLVVLTGVNDYWNPAETSADQGEGGLAWLHRLLSHLRTYKLGVLVIDYFRFGAAGGGGAEGGAKLETLQTRTGNGGPEDAAVHELHFGDATFSFRNERRSLLLTDAEHEAHAARNLRRIVDIADAAGVPLVLPTYAANLGHYGVANRTIMGVHCATVVPQFFRAHLEKRIPAPRPRDDQLFFPDLHPKAPVYRAYAESLCEALVKEKLVPLDRCVHTANVSAPQPSPSAPQPSQSAPQQ